MDRWLGVSTVARRLQVTSKAIRQRIHLGQIEAVQSPTGYYWICASELARVCRNPNPAWRKVAPKRS